LPTYLELGGVSQSTSDKALRGKDMPNLLDFPFAKLDELDGREVGQSLLARPEELLLADELDGAVRGGQDDVRELLRADVRVDGGLDVSLVTGQTRVS
jgi:hypothetical protein